MRRSVCFGHFGEHQRRQPETSVDCANPRDETSAAVGDGAGGASARVETTPERGGEGYPLAVLSVVAVRETISACRG